MIKVVHVMADGSVRDSIEGIVVPSDHPAYQIIKDYTKQKQEVKRESA